MYIYMFTLKYEKSPQVAQTWRFRTSSHCQVSHHPQRRLWNWEKSPGNGMILTIWLWHSQFAMENPNHKWRFRSLGKSSISVGHLYHGYVTNNQRAPINEDGISYPDAPWCWNIYLYIYHKHGPNVGQYSSTMEHLG